MMKRRNLGMGLLVTVGFLATNFVTACSSDGAAAPEEHGSLNLPLKTQGLSGTTYRLRDATFEITSQYYYSASGGEGGAGSTLTTVSSESNPNAEAISVDLERGYYYVRLLPGWRMEKLVDGVAEDVEATLLSSETQWAYVAAHSSSWVEYQFGIGNRALWFNGELNVQIGVYEKPSDLYGGAGAGGGGTNSFGGDSSTGGV
jgi:hypothetical protein